MIEELDQFGAAVARYVQGPGVDEPLMMQRAGAVSYYEADGLGTVTSLSTTAGALANTYTYDAFGKLTASTGTVVNSYRYTGRELDSETGMYYYRARYYDQGAGRFISEDPLRLSGGDTNFYAYVHNGPVGSEDPFGLARCFYQVAAHTLTCLSNYQPKVGPPYGVQIGPEGVHSGAGECKDQDRCVNTKDKGPITPGYYRMNLDTRPQHAGWGLYRLEPWPHHIYDGLLYRYGDKRGGFELHIGSITYGCINVDKTNPQAVEQYHNMQTILESQDGDNYLTVEP